MGSSNMKGKAHPVPSHLSRQRDCKDSSLEKKQFIISVVGGNIFCLVQGQSGIRILGNATSKKKKRNKISRLWPSRLCFGLTDWRFCGTDFVKRCEKG